MTSFTQLMQGGRGLYIDVDRRRTEIDTRNFDWQSPFIVKGIWTLTPQPINQQNRGKRDEMLQLLHGTPLARNIWTMIRESRSDQRERGAVILPGGEIGRIVRGERNSVNFVADPGVRVIGDVHTHPPSPNVAPPSLPEDFHHRWPLLLVAESGSGRLWAAFWRCHIALLGKIEAGRFEQLDAGDPQFNVIFEMRSR